MTLFWIFYTSSPIFNYCNKFMTVYFTKPNNTIITVEFKTLPAVCTLHFFIRRPIDSLHAELKQIFPMNGKIHKANGI